MNKLRVRCKLPNASELISGVRFDRDDDGAMVSEPVDEATAARFCSINGYDLVEDAQPPEPPEPPPPSAPEPADDPVQDQSQDDPATDSGLASEQAPEPDKPTKGKPGRKTKAAQAPEETEE